MPSASPGPHKPVVRWRKQPSEQGHARIGQSPRGFEVTLDGECIGGAFSARASWSGPHYWYCYVSDHPQGRVPRRNTASSERYPDVESARAACAAYVRQALAEWLARAGGLGG